MRLENNDRSIMILPFLMMIVIFMEFLDMTIVNTAIPSIAKSFAVPPLSIKFAAVSYFLGLVIFLPISGWCIDKFGYKTIFICSVFLFAIASWFCAKSHNIEGLTVFRFLQGVGGAFMNPVARVMVVRKYPAEKLVKIQGLIFAPAILGMVLGPFLGGALSQYASWQWIFYINIPFSFVAILLGVIYITKNEVKGSNPIDIKGFILSSFALTGVIVFIESFNHYELFSPNLVFCFGFIGIIALVILYHHCRNTTNAIFNLHLLKVNTISISLLINILLYTLNSGMMFLLPLMYQENFNLSPYRSGALIIPISIGYFLARVFSSRIIEKIGFRKTIFYSSGIVCISVLCFSLIKITTSIYFIVLLEFLLGVGFVFINSSTSALIYFDVDKKHASEITTLDLVIKHFSTSLGIGVSTLVLVTSGRIIGQNEFFLGTFHYTYIMIAALPLLATIISSKIRRF